ncbi:MAG: hypothetical protein JXA73_22860 [Acidobacteria bacterium]|nr:hypothetical protein [Acidobacteriota bacterium]
MTQGFLERYLKAEPNVFREYVAHPNTDQKVQFDDGDLIQTHKAIELMSNDFGIKLLIPVCVAKHDVLRLLNRMIPFIEASGVDPDSIDEADFL